MWVLSNMVPIAKAIKLPFLQGYIKKKKFTHSSLDIRPNRLQYDCMQRQSTNRAYVTGHANIYITFCE